MCITSTKVGVSAPVNRWLKSCSRRIAHTASIRSIAVITWHPTPMETIHRRLWEGGSSRKTVSKATIPNSHFPCQLTSTHPDSLLLMLHLRVYSAGLSPPRTFGFRTVKIYYTQGRQPKRAPGTASVPGNAQSTVPAPPAVPAQCTSVPPTNTLRSEGGEGATNERPQKVSFNNNVAVFENQGAEEAKNAWRDDDDLLSSTRQSRRRLMEMRSAKIISE